MKNCEPNDGEKKERKKEKKQNCDRKKRAKAIENINNNHNSNSNTQLLYEHIQKAIDRANEPVFLND